MVVVVALLAALVLLLLLQLPLLWVLAGVHQRAGALQVP